MNVIKDVTFEGRILDQIQKTIDYLETQVKEHSYLGEDGLFKTDREYPKFVIQDMTVNSVCHRDYSIKTDCPCIPYIGANRIIVPDDSSGHMNISIYIGR